MILTCKSYVCYNTVQKYTVLFPLYGISVWYSILSERKKEIEEENIILSICINIYKFFTVYAGRVNIPIVGILNVFT